MISSMYRRRMKAALLASGVIFIIGAVVILIDLPDSSNDWINVTSIGIVFFIMLMIAVSSRNKYIRVKNMHVPESTSSIFDLDHLVLKKDVGFFPCLLLFEKSGQFIGTIKPQRTPFLLYLISLLLRDSLVTMLPVSYGLYSNKSNLLSSFKRKGIVQSVVTVKNAQGQKIGEYVQDDFKSMVTIKGKLNDERGNTILPVEIKGFSGDFTLTDAEGRRWAHFYDGYFPHEWTKFFGDMENDIVNLSDELSEKHKILLISMIGFIFLQRSK